MKTNGKYWMAEYVKEHRPSYLLQRTDPEDGIIELSKTSEQLEWLLDNYELVKRYDYDVTEIWQSKWKRKIAGLGEAVPYYLYQLK